MNNIADIRKDYKLKSLQETDVAKDPFVQFNQWWDEAVASNIDEVNAMSSEELKSKYRETLDHGQVSAKGGAGLGIIDIARKSGNKLEYDFKQVNEKYCFFSLSVKVAAV